MHTLITTFKSLLVSGVLIISAACSGDDGGEAGVDANGGGASCTVSATATPMTANRTITGHGSVQCNSAASISIEVCVQWNASGSFADIMCQSSTMSGVMQHQLDNVSSCGITAGRRYRTRVNASINGAAQNEVLSTEVSCF